MRIGIDASPFRFQNRRGVANNVYQIIKVWIHKYPQNDYYLIASSPIYLDIELPKNWHIIDAKKKYNSIYWNNSVLPHIIRKLRLDVFWGADFLLPPNVEGVDYYVSVYDMAFILFWNNTPVKRLLKMGIFCKGACERAKKVITISKSSADDICRIFRIPCNKVFVSYLGGIDNKPTEHDVTNIRPELKIEDFFLFISGFEPRKNIMTIVKAFERYREKYGKNEKLVLAGAHDYKYKEVLQFIDKSKYKESIILPGYINEDEKHYLFEKAICLLYPSLYEGFGIPILEGFDYGLPVITASVSSMPEVGGDAAFYIKNPKGTNELASVMRKVKRLNAEQLEVCREKMRTQTSKFSWEKNATEIMEMIEKHRSCCD